MLVFSVEVIVFYW